MTSPKVTASAENSTSPIHFGAYSINPVTGELRKDGLPVHLPRQASQLLLLLLEDPGRIRSRDELKRILWAGEAYGDFDHGLNKSVYSLRAALGDLARSPRLIETLNGQGYRFIGTIRVDRTSPQAPLPWPDLPMAVMPFAVASPDLNWISIQITAQVIDQLSKEPGLKVLAYSQVRSLLPRDDQHLLHERYGVRAMVLGDLKSDSDELYVHGEMVDSLDGTQMWGFHARLSLRGRDCADRVAEGIVTRIKAARAKECKVQSEAAGEMPLWSRFGRSLAERWRNRSWRTGGDVMKEITETAAKAGMQSS
ncbi:MAG TPA: winged helix-turn-helix domain-containing protein [Acidobacteriaceae bacterium]|nr:winged helix-turn-helix domain-containing protein [Acidobacteriaceae bacterium]